MKVWFLLKSLIRKKKENPMNNWWKDNMKNKPTETPTSVINWWRMDDDERCWVDMFVEKLFGRMIQIDDKTVG